MNAPTAVAEPLTLVDIQQRPAALPAQAAPARPVTPADMLAIAVERNATIEQMERLFALKVQFERYEAEKAMNEAMAAFHAEPIAILKRKHVHFSSSKGDVSYWHAELSDVTDAISPAMGRHGLSYRWDVKQEQQKVIVTCIVSHRLGHRVEVTMEGPLDESGLKNRIQQAGSTVTYLQRYTLLSAIGKSTKGMDNDGSDGSGGDQADAAAQQQNTEEEQLKAAGYAAADHGMRELTRWWGGLNKRQRSRMNSEFGLMRKTASNVDQGAGRVE